MPRKSGRKRKTPSIAFHRDFVEPSVEDRSAALGPFPGALHTSESRREMILRRPNGRGLIRPSLIESSVTAGHALSDLDDERLFKHTPQSETNRAIAHPSHELDWLAQIPEKGQTFDDYVTFQTSRAGRIRPIANAEGEEILLLPIVRESAVERRSDGENLREDDSKGQWPSHGPQLDLLAKYTQAFFDRKVIVLSPAVVSMKRAFSAMSATQKSKKPGAFTSCSGRNMFDIRFPPKGASGHLAPAIKINGRGDFETKHFQLEINSMLNALSSFRDGLDALWYNGDGHAHLTQNFCVMGITMEDLYDSPSDLFCAGMAYGGSKVAVFSFCRYHPHLKMSPQCWHDFVYTKRAGTYSYYDNDAKQKPKGTITPIKSDDMSLTSSPELLRRSAKLLVHELGHLYGLDHCIFNRCLMNGTAHLVEDFAAPSHLCGVCLRKLQWRLGFDVKGRYASLVKAFSAMGMAKEKKWAQQQHDALVQEASDS